MGVGSVDGAIEVDEAFFRGFFKGNHKKIQSLLCYVKPIKMALRIAEAVRLKKGISKEQVCTKFRCKTSTNQAW